MSDDITKDPEYIRGREEYLEYEKKQEEERKSPYLQGWLSAHNRRFEQATKGIEVKVTTNSSGDDDPIKQLREEMKELDRRLKRLERYTQE